MKLLPTIALLATAVLLAASQQAQAADKPVQAVTPAVLTTSGADAEVLLVKRGGSHHRYGHSYYGKSRFHNDSRFFVQDRGFRHHNQSLFFSHRPLTNFRCVKVYDGYYGYYTKCFPTWH